MNQRLTRILAVLLLIALHSGAQAAGEVVAWGRGHENSGFPHFGQARVPNDLSEVTQIAVGAFHSLALTELGQVRVWGRQSAPPATIQNGVAIAAGRLHSLALDQNGRVVAWGDNSLGQMAVPNSLSNVVAIAAGDSHSLALAADGRLVAWGDNAQKQITIPEGCSNVVAIAAGGNVSLVLTADDRVLCWGAGYYGQTEVPPMSGIVAIAAGVRHNLALTANGRVIAWGNSETGVTNVPTDLANVVAIAAGDNVSYAIKEDGRVVHWGPGSPENVLADDTTLSQVVAIAVGEGHGLALVGQPIGQLAPQWSGSRYWSAIAQRPFAYRLVVRNGVSQFSSSSLPSGLILDSQTGLVHGTPTEPGEYEVTFFAENPKGRTSWAARIGVSPPTLAPVEISSRGKVMIPLGTDIRFQLETVNQPESFAATGLPDGLTIDSHTGFISGIPMRGGDSTVEVIARNSLSEASRSLTMRVSPVVRWGRGNHVPAGLSNVVSLTGVGGRARALTAGGQLLEWEGDLDTPSSKDASTLVAIAPTDLMTLGLTDSGQVLEWDSWSTLPIPEMPLVEEGLSNVVAIAARTSQFLALRSDGVVVAWGQYYDGFNRSPVQIPILLNLRKNVVAIAAGQTFGLALTKDGHVVQMDDLSWLNPNAGPVVTNAIAIAAGHRHALALQADGKVRAWGDNSHGQTNVPANLGPVVAIAAGDFHSLVLTSQGTVVAWGDNSQGQCNVPLGLSNVVALAAGSSDSFAVLAQPGVPLPELALNQDETGFELSAQGSPGLSGLLLRKPTLADFWRPEQPVIFTNQLQTLQVPADLGSTGYYQLVPR